MPWYVYTTIIAYACGMTVGFVLGYFFHQGSDNK